MRKYFYGWYIKCQSEEQTLAVIIAYHLSKEGKSASVQVITDDEALNFDYPFSDWYGNEKAFSFKVGKNRVDKNGMTLHLSRDGNEVEGNLRFGKFTPLENDIMGPFKSIPFLQCRHSVKSMFHTVDGSVTVNGKKFDFNNAKGYIEGDRGVSFPKVYSWTHTFFDEGSLMLSVADIPFGAFHFTGVIGVVYINGVEHRIATYHGAKAVSIEDGKVVVRQKDKTLTAKLIERRAHALKAPESGSMTRTIRESAACSAYYRFQTKKRETICSFETDRASFEYEYPN